jgi:hypothetical protein
MPNFQNGKVYKLINEELGLCYYGSTTTSLNRRLGGHRLSAKHKKITSHLLFEGNTHPLIQLLEEVPCDNEIELRTVEKNYILQHDENDFYKMVNKVIPLRTKKEYYLDNREKLIEKSNEWILANPERVKENRKNNYERTKDELLKPMLCECGLTTSKNHLLRHKKSIIHKNRMKSEILFF